MDECVLSIMMHDGPTVFLCHAGQFAFQEPYAVPFWSQKSQAWITYGTLTSDTGLSSTIMYGFAAPDGLSLLMAGSLQAYISAT